MSIFFDRSNFCRSFSTGLTVVNLFRNVEHDNTIFPAQCGRNKRFMIYGTTNPWWTLSGALGGREIGLWSLISLLQGYPIPIWSKASFISPPPLLKILVLLMFFFFKKWHFQSTLILILGNPVHTPGGILSRGVQGMNNFQLLFEYIYIQSSDWKNDEV